MIDLNVNSFCGKFNVFHSSRANMCTMLALISEIRRFDRREHLVQIIIIYWWTTHPYLLANMGKQRDMMTSWHGNSFRIISSLWGEPQVIGGFPSQRASNAEFLCKTEQAEQTLELPVVEDATTLKWHHSEPPAPAIMFTVLQNREYNWNYPGQWSHEWLLVYRSGHHWSK